MCDARAMGAPGQRAVHRPPGAEVPVTGHRLARPDDGGRLSAREIRIESLGAIGSAVAEFDRGLTVLTGETGTGKTMVVTGLHLLGGARADVTGFAPVLTARWSRAASPPVDLDGPAASEVTEILDSCGAERDDDGSVIASRSVASDGRSRAYLGGRSVPAKSLSTFTTELLTLHGQNDQLRLMRPDEQRAALDRYASVGPKLDRFRKLRNDWLQARRDFADRTDRAARACAGSRPAQVRRSTKSPPSTRFPERTRAVVTDIPPALRIGCTA